MDTHIKNENKMDDILHEQVMDNIGNRGNLVTENNQAWLGSKNVEFIDDIKLLKNMEKNTEKNSLVSSERLEFYAKMLFLGNNGTKKKSSFFEKYPQNLYLKTEDGNTIGAFIYKPDHINNMTKFFIVCHGKGCNRFEAGLLGNFESISKDLNSVFLLVDYRGFGDSTGEFTIDGVNLDILAAFKYLEFTYNTKNIAIVGHSLGTAIVLEYCRFAKVSHLDALPTRCFCLAPFSTVLEIIKDYRVGYGVISYFIPNIDNIMNNCLNYNNVENALQNSDRVFIFHGAIDKQISLVHSQRIVERAKCFYKATDDNHISIFSSLSTWQEIDKLHF